MTTLESTIRSAFAGVAAPTLTRDIHDDASELVTVPRELRADWRDLEAEALGAAARHLSDMDPEVFRYYLPGVLIRALRGEDRRRAAYSLAHALDLVFTRPAEPQRARSRVAILTWDQCRALEGSIIALDYLDQDWARRGMTWIERRRRHIDTAAVWFDHLHDRHALAGELCRDIESAFDGVPPPDEAHLTLYQAEAADHWGHADRSRDALGRWQDLPDEHVLDCQWALPWLDAQGMRHYLPAIMTYVLRTSANHTDDGWHDGPSHLSQKDWAWLTFLPVGYDRRARLARSLSLFTRDQRRALGQFLWFQEANASLRAAWLRLMEAERHEARADWLDILSADMGPSGALV